MVPTLHYIINLDNCLSFENTTGGSRTGVGWAILLSKATKLFCLCHFQLIWAAVIEDQRSLWRRRQTASSPEGQSHRGETSCVVCKCGVSSLPMLPFGWLITVLSRAGSVCSMESFPVLSRASSRNMDRDWENGSIASSITSMEYNGEQKCRK